MIDFEGGLFCLDYGMDLHDALGGVWSGVYPVLVYE